MWATDRPTTTARGYGATHQAARQQWQQIINQQGAPCSRGCGNTIHTGDTWHLDHSDDRRSYLGPSCARCNLAAAGKAGRAARPKTRRSKGGPVGQTANRNQ